MNLLELLRQLWDPVSTPVLLVMGGLLSHFWQRYLRRLAVFRWSSTHSRLAAAADHPNIGRIDVLWNNNAVNNLQFCNVEFENESSKDFQNVEIKFIYNDGTQFLGNGSVFGTYQFLPYTGSYGELVQRLIAAGPDNHNQAELQMALTRREYTIPVFNRGSRLTLSFLVQPPTMAAPTLQVACEHPGVRIYQRAEGRPMLHGVVQAHAAAVGILLGGIVTIAIASQTDRVWLVGLSAFWMGAFGTLIGAAAVRLKRLVVRAIG